MSGDLVYLENAEPENMSFEELEEAIARTAVLLGDTERQLKQAKRRLAAELGMTVIEGGRESTGERNRERPKLVAVYPPAGSSGEPRSATHTIVAAL